MTEIHLNKSKRDYSLILITISCICALIQLAAMPYNQQFLMQWSNRAMLAIWIVIVGCMLINRFLQQIPRKLLLLVAVVVFVSIAWAVAAIENIVLAGENLLKVVGFLTLPFMLAYGLLFEIDERAKNVIIIFGFLCSLLFIYLYQSELRNVYVNEYGVQELKQVTLGYSNPNQTAMYLFLCSMLLFIGASFIENKILKIVFSLDSCFIAWMMIKTESRTAISLFLMFVLLALSVRKRKPKKIFAEIAVWMPVIIMGLILDMQDDVIFLNESFETGRKQLYGQFFKQLDLQGLFLGNLNTYQFQNLHNGYLAILASAGVLTLAGYIGFLLYCVRNGCPGSNDHRGTRIAYVAFLCLIAYTSSEAAFFVGGANFSFLVFSVFALFIKPVVKENAS